MEYEAKPDGRLVAILLIAVAIVPGLIAAELYFPGLQPKFQVSSSSGGSGTPSGGGGTSPVAGVKIIIPSGVNLNHALDFTPSTVVLVIGVNNTVVWRNNDNVIHTASGTNFTGFTTGNIQPGASASYTFNTAGTYPYHCIYHPGMVGTVIVKGSVLSAASTASSGGGGIPEFPFQTAAVVIFTGLVVVSYLLARGGRRAVGS